MKYKKLLYDELIGHRDNIASINSWFACKDYIYKWDMYTCNGGTVKPKHRYRRSVISRHEVRLFGRHLRPTWTVYTRPAKPIGRKKHGKWLYMPKRVIVY